MKPSLAPVILLALSVATSTASAAHGTADWARAHAAQFIGQRVTLRVGWCEPGRIDGDEQWFSLSTYSKDGHGGFIDAVMLAEDAGPFFSRIGGNRKDKPSDWMRARTKPVSGTLRMSDGGEAYLDMRPARRNAMDASSKNLRTWTSTDGRTFIGEYISASSTHVTVRRRDDGRVFTIELEKLSEADRTWVAKRQ